jgi:hypothetical protein
VRSRRANRVDPARRLPGGIGGPPAVRREYDRPDHVRPVRHARRCGPECVDPRADFGIIAAGHHRLGKPATAATLVFNAHEVRVSQIPFEPLPQTRQVLLVDGTLDQANLRNIGVLQRDGATLTFAFAGREGAAGSLGKATRRSARSSACSSSMARIPSIILRVVGSRSPRYWMMSR